jgi:hypothetical protein
MEKVLFSGSCVEYVLGGTVYFFTPLLVLESSRRKAIDLRERKKKYRAGSVPI